MSVILDKHPIGLHAGQAVTATVIAIEHTTKVVGHVVLYTAYGVCSVVKSVRQIYNNTETTASTKATKQAVSMAIDNDDDYVFIMNPNAQQFTPYT